MFTAANDWIDDWDVNTVTKHYTGYSLMDVAVVMGWAYTTDVLAKTFAPHIADILHKTSPNYAISHMIPDRERRTHLEM
jgi:hypothetical protein